jgi:hypothetical protein
MLFSFQRPSALLERSSKVLQGETKASPLERPTTEPRWAAIGSRHLRFFEPSAPFVPLGATSEYSAI